MPLIRTGLLLHFHIKLNPLAHSFEHLLQAHTIRFLLHFSFHACDLPSSSQDDPPTKFHRDLKLRSIFVTSQPSINLFFTPSFSLIIPLLPRFIYSSSPPLSASSHSLSQRSVVTLLSTNGQKTIQTMTASQLSLSALNRCNGDNCHTAAPFLGSSECEERRWRSWDDEYWILTKQLLKCFSLLPVKNSIFRSLVCC